MTIPTKDKNENDLKILLGENNLQENEAQTPHAIALAKLHPFREHPYKVEDNDEMAELCESICTHGVLSPILVRPTEDGEYEIVSGHRRVFACRRLGLKDVPAIVQPMTQEEAVLKMVDSNLHRERLLPSEKAFAYVDEGYGMSDMALHIKTLEIFFNLYLPSLSDMQKAILKQAVIELYNSFNIFWDTDITALSNRDFPTFSDLHKLLEKKTKANKEQTVYRDLALLLNDIASGSDSFLWNGHTTIETQSRFVCLDTHSLQNTSDNIKRTQYFNRLTWC